MHRTIALPAFALLVCGFTTQPDLGRIAQATDGTVGVSIVHLETGESIELNSTERFPMASVYKLPIAIAVLRQVQRGALTMDGTVHIDAEDYYPGYSPLRDNRKRRSADVSVRELLEQMVVKSDNTACDVLIVKAGGAAAINGELERLGVSGIDVSRTEAEVLVDLHGLGAAPAGRWTYTSLGSAIKDDTPEKHTAERKSFLGDPRDTASPAALTTLLVRLVKGELLDVTRTAWILDAMQRSMTGPDRLRAGAPAGTWLAHKTGTNPWVGVVNDAGVYRLPDGTHVAVAVLIKGSTRSDKVVEKVIADVGRFAYRRFVK